jgi:hypothetical protein
MKNIPVRHPLELLSQKTPAGLPTFYLRWLLTWDGLPTDAVPAIKYELGQRKHEPARRAAQPAKHIQEVMRRWYHDLSREYHPDMCGSNDAMKIVNHARDMLKHMFEEAA